jgi:uncharacterized protein YodC (DUF2158 family)
MTDFPFKAGDVVRLKSGGPKMTVDQVAERAMTLEPTVWCSWFDGAKKISDTFAPDALEAVSNEPLSRGSGGGRILDSRF